MASALSFLPVLLAALVATASLSLSPASAAKCHPEDKKVLLAIKRFWNNPSRLASWVPSTGCCSWEGVSCDYLTGHVTALRISDDDSISGTIPPAVGNLPLLSTLEITGLPHLSGPIPSTLSRLSKLEYLRLDKNDLTGPVSAFLAQFPELWYLDLGFNRLSGPIPGAIAGLPKLHRLSLEHNQLTGTVPAEFGKFQLATVMVLSHNNLSGPLPPELGAVDFGVIDLSWNRLSGDATFLFGKNKVELGHIDLSMNMFEFDLSHALFPTVWELRSVNISHNRIYGRIPKQITEVVDLYSLDVSYNRLCGEIPRGGKLDAFKIDAYAHNQCLCGKPLPPCK